jgi:rRNA processing protein Gar1
LIVRASGRPVDRINHTVVTREGRRVGRVYDVFGPVKRPYVSIKRFKSERLNKLDGEWIYLL